ncbi:chorion class CA protein ERA.1-like [Bombyx mori]|uniref:Chorion early A n=1 Tax=Bombyx mori TaxID=7091 RepID=A0A0K2S2X3_BOMMO|nr:chorion class CA protein ERA.1-like [Bombyx mori]BAS21464.1 chorion early A [Bombyx mori]
MSSFTIFLFVVQACLVQNALCQCYGGYNPGPIVNGYSGPIGGPGYGPPGCGGYGGTGVGTVAIAGELPVGGTTVVSGQVPVVGCVEFEGPACAAGSVTISGNCVCSCGVPGPILY